MLSATCWALDAAEAQSPTERLILLLLAECTDEFGLAIVDLPRLAGRALCTPDRLAAILTELERRGILRSVPDAVAAFAAATGIAAAPGRLGAFLLSAWPERARLALGSVHPAFGMLSLQ
jgi:hypothetical protein